MNSNVNTTRSYWSPHDDEVFMFANGLTYSTFHRSKFMKRQYLHGGNAKRVCLLRSTKSCVRRQ